MDKVMRQWNLDMQGKGVRGSIFKVDMFLKNTYNEGSIVKALKEHHRKLNGFKACQYEEDAIATAAET